MRINTNMSAMNAWRNLTVNNGNLQKSLEKLSSGYRINRAADDAAGLAVSEKMRAQIRGLNQATRNAQDGIALVQTAEGGAGQIQNMLQRMRELTVQSSNGALQDADRAQLNTEFQALKSEIDRTAGSISYNNIKLLAGTTGTGGSVRAVTSSNSTVGSFTAGSTAVAGVYNVNVTALASAGKQESVTGEFKAAAGTGAVTDSGYVLKVGTTTVFSASAGQTVDKQAVADAINNNADVNTTVQASYDANTGKLTVTNKATGATGAGQFTMTETYANGTSPLAGAADSLFNDADGAITVNGTDASYTVNGGAAQTSLTNDIAALAGVTGVSAKLTGIGSTSLVVTNNASSAAASGTVDLKVQIGANDGDTLDLSLAAMGRVALGIDTLSIDTLTNIGSGTTGTLQRLDSAINSVSTARAGMGAAQNRLENIVGTLTVQSENLTGAESRIRDVDMASEMSTFTKNNILSQASQSMLAQANQGTQGILSLLRG